MLHVGFHVNSGFIVESSSTITRQTSACLFSPAANNVPAGNQRAFTHVPLLSETKLREP